MQDAKRRGIRGADISSRHRRRRADRRARIRCSRPGALQRAESLYYAAARAHPRDPAARWALGRYLVARGAPRVGMTLFEEAIQFGGDASKIGADLAPVYLSLGEYQKLSALRAAPIPKRSASERGGSCRIRRRWLRQTRRRRCNTRNRMSLPESARSPSESTGAHSRRRFDARSRTRHVGHERDRKARARVSRAGGPGSSQGAPAVADSIGLGGYSLGSCR